MVALGVIYWVWATLTILKGHRIEAAMHAMHPTLLRSSCVALLLSLGVSFASTASKRACTVDGFYDAGAATSLLCPGALPCEPGFYCTGGRRFPCPAGTYGPDPELRLPSCSGRCPAGFFCPQGTAEPFECGSSALYCPVGSASPQPVPEGFYSIGMSSRRRERVVACEPGNYCTEGNKYPCPAGTYGADTKHASPSCTAPCPAGHYCPVGSVSPVPCAGGLYGSRTGETSPSCSGQCREGFYCPRGSITSTAYACGVGTYCPRGSANPQYPVPGHYVVNGGSKMASKALSCPVGSYCPSGNEGDAVLCPPGTYGDAKGLRTSVCSGRCAPGFYCPRGSTSATAVECGGADVFCPPGSSVPTPVSPGYYTVGRLPLQGKDQGPVDSTTRHAQRKCEPGYYCVGGVRFPCRGGTYGSQFGLQTPQCSGQCAWGHYCPLRSTVATARRCGSSTFYCPMGSATPTRVDEGFCSAGGRDPQTQSTQRLAQPGEFAFLGTCYPCPAGSYGDGTGETRARCAGDCHPGHYCPPGSSRSTEEECGGPHVYCPTGSKSPLPVNEGYYTSIDTQEACPPGRFRDFSTTVSAFIEIVTGSSAVAVNYGDFAYPLAQCSLCPGDTFKPVSGDDSALCVACPTMVATPSRDRRTCECFRLPGGGSFDATRFKLHFNGTSCDLKALDYVDAAPIEAERSIFTRFRQLPCERGYYCQNGIRRPCPAGVYGDKMFESRSQCSGPCSPGFYCPLASTNSTARACGAANVYCPESSPQPNPVAAGYYTVRTASSLSRPGEAYNSLNASWNAHIRDEQKPCEPGYYCVLGRKYICPAGRYGDQSGETAPLCAGLCRRGYYCPAGSISATERPCGGSAWVCRTGAPEPVRVSVGYYSVGGNAANTTRVHQMQCEPGFFCVDGVKYQCPAGTYGATPGLSSSQCSGLCQAGYYCPSYPYPPSISATQNECGNSTVYCPEAMGNFPRLADNGFFTIGAGDGTGDAKNTTRVAQQVCPRGSYCRGGIRIRCPEGTFGEREGLTSTQCSGWCPAGYFCPYETADYRLNKCPPGTYSVAGSSACMACTPGQNQSTATVASIPEYFHLVSAQARQQPCTDKRECCFFG